MLAFNVLRNALIAVASHGMSLAPIGFALGIVSTGAFYLLDYPLNYEFSSASAQFGEFAELVMLTSYMVIIVCTFLLLTPFEILALRTLNPDINEQAGSEALRKSVLPYAYRYFGIFMLASLLAAAFWLLFFNAQQTTSPTTPITELPLSAHLGHLWRSWISVRVFDAMLVTSLFLLCFQIIGIALGHKVKFIPSVVFQSKRILHIITVAILFDTVFFVCETYLAGAFGRLYLDTQFDPLYTTLETLVTALYSILFLALMAQFYRVYHDQAFENTKAASMAASVFD